MCILEVNASAGSPSPQATTSATVLTVASIFVPQSSITSLHSGKPATPSQSSDLPISAHSVFSFSKAVLMVAFDDKAPTLRDDRLRIELSKLCLGGSRPQAPEEAPLGVCTSGHSGLVARQLLLYCLQTGRVHHTPRHLNSLRCRAHLAITHSIKA